MTKELVRIDTRDGKCPTGVFRPNHEGAGPGPWPGIIVFMDGIGMRPALDPIAERIADHGYFVLLPDMFYRVGPYTAPEPAKLFGEPELRAKWYEKISAARDPNNLRSDIEAFLAFLSAQDAVRGTNVGTTGYCMGGRISILAAAWFPERIKAAGSFHPSGLATDEPESPHRLASKIRAKVYVAGATGDPGFDDAQRQRFDDALAAAGVDRTVVAYPAKHGWVPNDTPVHDAAQTERHYEALFALFDDALKG